MNVLILILFFIFGLLIGSFANVVILRLSTGRGFGGRSSCMSCRKKLSWYELIPVVSFLIQKGRCRECRTRVSFQYPIVEFLTGVVSVLIYLQFQAELLSSPLFFSFWYSGLFILWILLLIIAVYDIRHTIIPDKILVPAYILVLILLLARYYPEVSLIGIHIASGLVIASPFAILFFLSRGRWIGFGDVKLFAFTGLFLALFAGVITVLLSIYLGALYGVVLVLLRQKRYTWGSEIPFGPFIILATALVFFTAGTTYDITLFIMTRLFS